MVPVPDYAALREMSECDDVARVCSLLSPGRYLLPGCWPPSFPRSFCCSKVKESAALSGYSRMECRPVPSRPVVLSKRGGIDRRRIHSHTEGGGRDRVGTDTGRTTRRSYGATVGGTEAGLVPGLQHPVLKMSSTNAMNQIV